MKQSRILLFIFVISLGMSGFLLAQSTHLTITEYKGPSTCLACHQTQAQEMFASVHYQWKGPTPNVPNITGQAGKGAGGFNTYCGTPASSPQSTCMGCHTGYGKAPSDTMTTEQLNNIDCMLCHQDQYKRKPLPPSPPGDFNLDRLVSVSDLAFLLKYWLRTDCLVNDCQGVDMDLSGDVALPDYSLFAGQWQKTGQFFTAAFTDYLGVERTYQIPGDGGLGDYQYTPDLDNMSISILQAAQTVHLPTRASCLKCHAYAGGGDGIKRGDISSVTADPPLASDQHMSSLGQNFTCAFCHLPQNHKMLGRGLDLRPNDRPEPLVCNSCHTDSPHLIARLNKHTSRVACQTCHIPTYAKDMATEVVRDWNHPVWNPNMLNGQGGFEPNHISDSDLIPTYQWYDGTSNVYILGQVPTLNSNGEYDLATPNGNINSAGAKIRPMKEHWSNSALHDASGQLIPHSTFKFFTTGDFNQAVQDGMTQAGMNGSYTMVDLHTYQTINHGVEPKTNALGCGECHSFYAGQNLTRMNLQGQLGYQPKASLSCSLCHTLKTADFEKLHQKHVDNFGYPCSTCHDFSR